MSPVAPINIAALWPDSGKLRNLIKSAFEGVTIVGIPFKALSTDNEPFFVGDADTDFVAEFVFLMSLAFADTGNMGFMQAVELVTVTGILTQ